MSKNSKSSQFPKGKKQNSVTTTQATPPKSPNPQTPSLPINSQPVKPEEMSLLAHSHIQAYKSHLNKEDVNAVLRLSQHLRVFGLLSAVGYVNQSNEQGGKVRERTVPVWECLLGRLIDAENPPNRRNLMTQVQTMAQNEPQKYLLMWRKALLLSKHWNFWAKAYEE